MMKSLFLDTANIEEIRRLIRSDAIRGVTTNPSLMAKEAKGDYIEKLKDIMNLVGAVPVSNVFGRSKHLSVEAISLDPQTILEQGFKLHGALSGHGAQLYVKVPVTFANLEVITKLVNGGVKVNATACMNVVQAKLAADSGAQIVSFFYNRIKDGGENPNKVLSDFAAMGSNCEVICGSIRTPQDVIDAWYYGADIVTASSKVIAEMIQHPQTDKAIAQFQKDIDSWLS